MLDGATMIDPCEPAASELTTLIVDDELAVGEELAAFLARRGLRTVTAVNAIEALNMVSRRPDIGVIVADIRMPGASGLDLIAQLRRSSERVTDPAIIMMTAHGTLDDAVTALRLGALEFLRKPFRLAELEAVVRRALSEVKTRRGEHQAALASTMAILPQNLAKGLNSALNTDPESGLQTASGMQEVLSVLLRPDAEQLACLVCLRILISAQDGEDVGPEVWSAIRKEAMGRLRHMAALGDLVSSDGDNEFLILRLNATTESCMRWVEGLQEAMRAPYKVGNHEIVRPQIKLGVAHSAQSGTTSLLHAARTALSKAALLHAGCHVEWHSADPHSLVRLHFIMWEKIKHGSLAEGVQLRFQPVMSVPEQTLAGFETLVRWNDADLGVVPAHIFVPFAEKSGIMRNVDEIVLRQAIHQASVWRWRYDFTGNINVNVSPGSLQGNWLYDCVLKVLEETQFPPRQLCLEILETAMLQSEIFGTLASIRRLGVKIAIDDFGSGFSNLTRLLELPADMVKFDRAFLRAQSTGSELSEFLDIALSLIRSRRMTAVIEGVENQADWDLVRGVGFDAAQGYWLGMPMEAEDAARILSGKRGALPIDPRPRDVSLQMPGV